MSQHRLKAFKPREYEVVVGWDRKLQWYWGHVILVPTLDEPDEEVVSFESTDLDVFIEVVERELTKFAYIPKGLKEELADDSTLEYPASNRLVTWDEDSILKEGTF